MRTSDIRDSEDVGVLFGHVWHVWHVEDAGRATALVEDPGTTRSGVRKDVAAGEHDIAADATIKKAAALPNERSSVVSRKVHPAGR